MKSKDEDIWDKFRTAMEWLLKRPLAETELLHIAKTWAADNSQAGVNLLRSALLKRGFKWDSIDNETLLLDINDEDVIVARGATIFECIFQVSDSQTVRG